MWSSFPAFGTTLLLAVMVVASYTFAVALRAGATGRARTLEAARFGAYGTVALIGVTVLALAYAFVSHDFRLRYVSHYSDRSMSVGYLLTALWGGQDGSILWWTFLLSIYIGACVKWLGKKYLELQPYVLATLMAIVLFFCVLMAFSANPFAVSIAGARPDGEGLNPLLQNFYMIIHPPSLYTGFVGCSVPFAFAVAALVTGRLDTEWILASRKWMLFPWMFLGIGNTLGMLWAYEELGWGGYWAWDPVENAAFMPFLTASAYLHSVMIQERRGLFKVWNVVLVCSTFFMTIFGTFLTRAGLISSVHAFAQSSIGVYFQWFLILVALFSATLVFYRWPELRDYPATPRMRIAAVVTGYFMIAVFGPGFYGIYQIPMSLTARVLTMAVVAGFACYAGLELLFRRLAVNEQGTRFDLLHRRPLIESFASREFTFMLNNWALLGFMMFVLVATTFPLVAEVLWKEKVTVAAPYYNAWVQPLGLTIFALMGIGSLFGWRKTSPTALRKAFLAPTAAGILAAVLHFAIGGRFGFPAVVWSVPIYGGSLGMILRAFNAVTPVLGMSLVAFNAAVIVQEFVVLFRSRAKTKAASTTPTFLWWLGGLPGFAHALVSLPPQSRRRYGGYVVHFGIVLMFFGFIGKSWTISQEKALFPGETLTVDSYSLTYVDERMEVDNAKRMVFADVKVVQNGKFLGTVSPARFIYKRMPESPTTEIAMLHSLRDDLYVVVGAVNPENHRATLQVHVNPLVVWVWLGCIVLVLGSFVCMWPELEPNESRVWAYGRAGAAVAASVSVGILIAIMPTMANAQTTPSPAPSSESAGDGSGHVETGSVNIENENERTLFAALRCMCGDCPRTPLSTCTCTPAHQMRAELRRKLKSGATNETIIEEYTERFGTGGLTVPPNTGAMRAIYAVPIVAIAAAGMGLGVLITRWKKDSKSLVLAADAERAKAKPAPAQDAYDERLDEELKDLDS
ncbi:MAG: cytochrome c-type biogenesis CcmF C-terminal domain-containing protein [Polyangiaceae bacterium]